MSDEVINESPVLRTENLTCDLDGIFGAMEWSEPEQAEIFVISFAFKVDGEDRIVWKKCRPFSSRPDTAEKSLVAINQIDRALNAGGRINAFLTEWADKVSATAGGRLDLLPYIDPFFVPEQVRVIYRYAETINHRTQKPYISGYIHRVRQLAESEPEDESGFSLMMREAANFCWTREWLEVRHAVFNAVGTVCMCCGATKASAVITVDHVKPRSKYPTLALSPSNMQVLCLECNQGKGNDSEMDYRTFEQETALQCLEREMDRGDYNG